MNLLCKRLRSTINLYRAIHKVKTLKTCTIHTVINKQYYVQNPANYYGYNTIRCKSKKQQKDPDSDDEDNKNDFLDDDDYSLTKDSKVVKFNTTSLRTDMILKSALGIARNKVEQLFYESKIRVNGKKILKKSATVRPDFEIDVIKSISPKNPDHIVVARIIILNIVAKEESVAITVRRFKNLLIENYEEDPYKGSAEE
ncbi:mitochondrial transcription rescue factor 1 [Aricia agestis]|uniref:mitochondrial transcription rescue factor 1 n=1 Tax=Aricia agestis TaxID=91739 RepID=UPI001C20BE59|nr:mitochondrial transcription rescue factor 1 [Aricia agestis]